MNIFTQLWKSTYSPTDIAKFRFQKIGKSILYVFLLSLIINLPLGYYLANDVSSGANTIISTIRDKSPDFTIENGQLHSKSDKPLEFVDNNFTILFDSTGKLTIDDVKMYPTAFALLDKEMVLSTGGQVESFSYSTLQLSLDKKIFLEILKSFSIFIPILLVIFYFFIVAIMFVFTLLMATFGLAVKNSMQKRIDFKQLWTLSAYSTTLITLFFTLMLALRIEVIYGVAVAWFISITILYLAIREVPSPKKKKEQL